MIGDQIKALADLETLAPSIREQIIDRIEELLRIDGLQIHRERTRPIEEDELPAILIYCADEDPSPIGSQRKAPLVERELTILLECRATGAETKPPDKVLDPLLSWITIRIIGNESLDGLANGAEEGSTVWNSKEGDQPIASATKTVKLKYRTSRLDPTSRS